jgi:peptide chain release factor subunit 1
MFSECYVFEPPNPVTKFYYKCDKVFHLDDLLKLYVKHDTYAIVLISGKTTNIYSYSLNNVKLIKSVSVTLPGQFKTGGSSAARLGRIRDEKIGWYIKNMSEMLFKLLVKDNVFEHLGLFVAGPAELKNQLQDDNLFVQHFQKYLLQVVTIPEINDRSIYDVIDMVKGSIYGDVVDGKMLKEFELMLLDEKKINLMEFGIERVMKLLDTGELQEIYIDYREVELVKGYDVKVNVMNDETFKNKYGVVVGIRYYYDKNVYDEEI